MAETAMLCHIPTGFYTLGVSQYEIPALQELGLRFYTVTGIRRTYIRSFHIRTHPVSVAELFRFVEEIGDHEQIGYLRSFEPDLPAMGIEFRLAARYAKRMGGRLPTASEWEAAARGKSGPAMPFGKDNCPLGILGRQAPPAIGAHPELASPFGVQEVIGSVMEWTSDLFEGRAIAKGTPFNSSIACFADEAAYRRDSAPMFNVGFRYVLLD